MVELFTALSLVLVFIKIIPSDIYQATYLQWFALLNWWIATAFLILIFVYDFKYYLVADVVVLPAAAIAFVFNLVLGVDIWKLLLACVVGAGFFLLQFVISKGKWIGGGDIRIGLFMGALLGWPNILLALILAYTIGSIISIFLILGKQKQWTDRVPFGTFLTIATFASLLYGSEIIKWYFKLFLFY
jgi:prepilin signal peptidase PulO-like enzyme (type II secretory pathway)